MPPPPPPVLGGGVGTFAVARPASAAKARTRGTLAFCAALLDSTRKEVNIAMVSRKPEGIYDLLLQSESSDGLIWKRCYISGPVHGQC